MFHNGVLDKFWGTDWSYNKGRQNKINVSQKSYPNVQKHSGLTPQKLLQCLKKLVSVNKAIWSSHRGEMKKHTWAGLRKQSWYAGISPSDFENVLSIYNHPPWP